MNFTGSQVQKLLFRLSILFILGIIFLIFNIRNQNQKITKGDACLCTEILNTPTLTDNENKIPSVRQCQKLFKDFNSAHDACIESVPFQPVTPTQDSVDTI